LEEIELMGEHPTVDPLSRADHAGYLEELVRNVRQMFEKSLHMEMARRMSAETESRLEPPDRDICSTGPDGPALLWDLQYEMMAHWEACEEYSKYFIARQKLLDDLVDWIDAQRTREPGPLSSDSSIAALGGAFSFMFVRGGSGSGKSVLMAKLAQHLKERSKIRTRVIYRHLGSSGVSLNLLQTLRYLCLELSARMSATALADVSYEDELRIHLSIRSFLFFL
uniref:NACHT domain-containing protein n=1 Tax=Echinostoma caproni TaxID=27848 RepID=A0A183BAA7_9TREM